MYTLGGGSQTPRVMSLGKKEVISSLEVSHIVANWAVGYLIINKQEYKSRSHPPKSSTLTSIHSAAITTKE